MTNFNNRLYEIREKLDLKQKDIADILKVNRMSYSYWETSSRFIPLNKLNDYCNKFNFSMDYIFYLTNENFQTNNLKILNKKEIGNRLRQVFKENKITQTETAKMLNTTQSTISAYLNGKTLILTAFAYQICIKYKISLDWLVGRSNNKYLK